MGGARADCGPKAVRYGGDPLPQWGKAFGNELSQIESQASLIEKNFSDAKKALEIEFRSLLGVE